MQQQRLELRRLRLYRLISLCRTSTGSGSDLQRLHNGLVQTQAPGKLHRVEPGMQQVIRRMAALHLDSQSQRLQAGKVRCGHLFSRAE